MSRDGRRGSGRTAFGYYVPLFITVTLATGALTAWVWQQRDENNPSSPSDDEGLQYSDDPSHPPPPRPAPSDTQSTGVARPEDDGIVARVSSAIRRTPSPQQMFEHAKGTVTKAVGGVLGSIREEEGFGESERWREEASIQRSREGLGAAGAAGAVGAVGKQFTGRRKTAIIILDADILSQDAYQQEAGGYHTEDVVSFLVFQTCNAFLNSMANILDAVSTIAYSPYWTSDSPLCSSSHSKAAPFT